MKIITLASTFRIRRFLHSGLLLIAALMMQSVGAAESAVDQHQLGTKYSPLKQINKDNVTQLEKAWEFHTNDVMALGKLIAFEDQPSMIEGNLVVCSVARRVIALDPQTGKVRWTFDPKDPPESQKIAKCRGIANWVDNQAPVGAVCQSRIFLGTADYRLVAIDAKTGKPCDDFGDQGIVKMPLSKPEKFPGEVMATSAPAVVNDVIVMGSSVADNHRVDAPSGRVLAFDARTGEQLWEFDPVPRDPSDPAMKTWAKGTSGFGGGNVWSAFSVDQQRDLVFLPTTSVSGDFNGNDRAGDNEYTSSVVALRGKTGEVVWHFQTVHHDVFDFDVPTPGMLIDYPHNGKMVPALVQNTKTGMIFIFNRETGEPLIPIEERPVPQHGKVPGEVLSPTQPFPVGMPTVAPQGFTPDDAWGFSPIDEYFCRKKAEEYNYGPIFTPPSEKGTIFMPSSSGGPNWGGGAYDPASHIMVVPSNRVPMIAKLVKRQGEEVNDVVAIESRGSIKFANLGSPYEVQLDPLLSIVGAPCSAPPWAALTAVDIVNKKIVWEVPLGSIEKLAPVPIPVELGTPGAGGPLITAGGLVFIGYTLDEKLRAFDMQTGEVLWKTELPAAGVAVPVTYEVGGEQYVVIAAGGHSMYGTNLGDSIVAFKLKR